MAVSKPADFGEASVYSVTVAFPQESDTSALLVFGSMLPSNQKNEKREGRKHEWELVLNCRISVQKLA